MRSTPIKICILLAATIFASCAVRHKGGSKSGADGNYSYIYNADCKCVVTNNNPNGIVNVTTATYESDPDLHHINGYYTNLTGKKSDTMYLTNLSPTVYQCNPCMTWETGKKYIFYFEGKDTLPSIEIKISKNASGDIKLLK